MKDTAAPFRSPLSRFRALELWVQVRTPICRARIGLLSLSSPQGETARKATTSADRSGVPSRRGPQISDFPGGGTWRARRPASAGGCHECVAAPRGARPPGCAAGLSGRPQRPSRPGRAQALRSLLRLPGQAGRLRAGARPAPAVGATHGRAGHPQRAPCTPGGPARSGSGGRLPSATSMGNPITDWLAVGHPTDSCAPNLCAGGPLPMLAQLRVVSCRRDGVGVASYEDAPCNS